MGCFATKPEASEVTKTTTKQKDAKAGPQNIDNLKDLRIGAGDLVVEKTGKINKDYTLLNPPLGKGTFGEVRKAIQKQTQLVRAVKIISKSATSKQEQDRLKHEVEILKELDHPNIIKVYEFYQDSKFFYIVTDLCTGGELFDKIIDEKTFGENKAAETLKQILGAVNYCHKNKVVHRDLKPENILYESNKPGALLKVVDFGTSMVYDPNKKMQQRLGTAYYMAPEVLNKQYDEKCDVWSCGVVLYILLCGYPPFNGLNDTIILEKVRQAKYSFESDEWTYVSEDAKNLVRKMLEKDVKKRISAEEALNDPWVKKFSEKQDVDLPTLKRSLENMRTFRAGKKLQEATWMFFVNNLASKEEKNELLKAFQALDINGDGKLSREELVAGYQKVLNAAQAEEEVDKIMKSVDKNDSGEIDYSEWVMATINRESLLSKNRLETAFKMFDQDGSGTITIDEIKQMFGGNGAQISEKVWVDLLKEVDQNGDGTISFKEFKEMMMSLMNKAEDETIIEKPKETQ